jgi:hypothetical protein
MNIRKEGEMKPKRIVKVEVTMTKQQVASVERGG